MDRNLAKGTVSLILCIVGLFDIATAADPQAFPSAIQQQLNLPEHQIDIGLAALTFAKEFYPDLDVARTQTH
jgi:hypothetical protein